MVQNLKVDIIYHMSPSDFEMEFNLSGCCRMRLLSGKTTDKKSFIKTLARDVSRSRVIIACGPLFGNDGLITTVGTAIGRGVALCDNKTYGIKEDQPIHIINGSTPLVTPDGYFGGCIIESGPQTIILLTENRAFRKMIMQNLIHPYIEEISYIPAKTTPVPSPQPEPDPIFETKTNDSEVYLTQPDDYSDTVDEPVVEEKLAVEDEHNIEFIMDEEPSAEETKPEIEDPSPIFDNLFNSMYTEVETPQEIKSRYDEPYTTSTSDSMFIAERQVDDTKPEKKSASFGIDIAIVILVLLLLLSLLALVYLVVLRPVVSGISPVDYLNQIFGLAGATQV